MNLTPQNKVWLRREAENAGLSEEALLNEILNHVIREMEGDSYAGYFEREKKRRLEMESLLIKIRETRAGVENITRGVRLYIDCAQPKTRTSKA